MILVITKVSLAKEKAKEKGYFFLFSAQEFRTTYTSHTTNTTKPATLTISHYNTTEGSKNNR